MAVTDITTLILSIYFLVRGASRGFIHSLTAPFSIIVTTIISILYYQCTGNIVVSTLIGLIGPLLVNLFLIFLLKMWFHTTNSKIDPNFLSRLGGAVLTLVWGWVFIAFTLILLTVMPLWGDKLTAVYQDVTKSTSYRMVKPLENILFSGSKPNVTSLETKNDETERSGQADAKSLAQDPRFQKVLQDPDIQKEVDSHDIVKLMSNPKMMELVKEIMSDPATMKKVFSLYKSHAQLPSAK